MVLLRIPKRAEISMNVQFTIMLLILMTYIGSLLWMTIVLFMGVLQFFVSVYLMKKEEKEQQTESPYITIETHFTKDKKQNGKESRNYIVGIIASIIAISPAFFFLIKEKNVESASLEMYHHYNMPTLTVVLYTICIVFHMALQILHTQKKIKSYEGDQIYQLKTNWKDGKLIRTYVEEVLNEDYKKYVGKNIETYNEKIATHAIFLEKYRENKEEKTFIESSIICMSEKGIF